MEDLYKLILITTILVVGWKIATAEGMLLHSVSVWANKSVAKGYKIFELLTCPFCMPSVFSILGYGFAWICHIAIISGKVALMYPLVACGASILSGGIWLVYELITAKRDYYNLKSEYYNSFPDDDPNLEEEEDNEPEENYFMRSN